MTPVPVTSACITTMPATSDEIANPEPAPSFEQTLEHVRRGAVLDATLDELERMRSSLVDVRSKLDHVRSLRWTRLGMAPRAVANRLTAGTRFLSTSVDGVEQSSPERSPPAAAAGLPTEHAARVEELARTRAELERAMAERDRLRAELIALYDSRWTRAAGPARAALHQVQRLGGRHTSAPRRGESPADAADRRFNTGDYEAALEVLDTALATTKKADAELLRRRVKTLVRLGEVTEAFVTARELAASTRAPGDLLSEQTLGGRLRELDPLWLPDAGPTARLDPVGGQRVLHILKESRPYFERGYTMRSHYVLEAQRDAGLSPFVVTSLGFPRLDGFADFPLAQDIGGIPHYRLDLGPDYPYRRIPNDRFLSDYARQAASVVERVRPTVIHANSGYRGFETALVALALGRRFGLPVVYDVRSFLEATWTPDVERSERGEHYRLRLARELACMQRADLVFTIAETMRDAIVGRGVDPDKIVVIPNAVDPDEFQPVEPDAGLIRDLGLAGRPVLGYVSNIGRREGLDVLVEALTLLIREGRDVAGLIVGDGPELPGIRSLIAERGLTGRVHAVGQVPHDEIRRYYSVIDVFVIPRRGDEAARHVTPLKPFEAMAMARPLLVADLPALTEVTGNGARGMSFAAEDPHDLARAAATLLDDPLRRRRMGEAGRRWVEAERSWRQNGRRYVDAYDRLLIGAGVERGER